MSSTGIIESDNVKFSKSEWSMDGVWSAFLETDSTCKLSKKNEYFKNVNFLIIFYSQ